MTNIENDDNNDIRNITVLISDVIFKPVEFLQSALTAVRICV